MVVTAARLWSKRKAWTGRAEQVNSTVVDDVRRTRLMTMAVIKPETLLGIHSMATTTAAPLSYVVANTYSVHVFIMTQISSKSHGDKFMVPG